jgi:hypothetical protein
VALILPPPGAPTVVVPPLLNAAHRVVGREGIANAAERGEGANERQRRQAQQPPPAATCRQGFHETVEVRIVQPQLP